jgi:hypothetical protein
MGTPNALATTSTSISKPRWRDEGAGDHLDLEAQAVCFMPFMLLSSEPV